MILSNQVKRLFCFLFCLFILNSSFAGPWLLPGSLSVKSDIDLLADAGLIKAPVMIWPIAWANIGPDLLSDETKKKLSKEPESVQQAYQRILTLYQQSYQPYKAQTAIYASGSNRLNPFRTFQYEPYAKLASGVSSGYQMKHFAESINVSYYHAPNQSYSDDVHLDNSYAYLLSENWAFGVDQFNRWWGPGYSGSMILSQNAEPFPTIDFQRIKAKAFQTKWLHWIGPWTLASYLSEDGPSFYSYPSGVDNILFWYTSVSFKPLQSLQFDISRSTHFAGKQRPVTGNMLLHILSFQNAYSSDIPGQDVPGSDEWDIGLRWGLQNTFHIPVDLYMQTLFSGIYGWVPLPIPDCTTFLLGASVVTQLSASTLRTYFEYENNIEWPFYFWGRQKADPTGGVIPNPYGGPYPYTYYNRLLGSPLGSEGIGYTLGMILNESNGNSDTASLRFLQPNYLNMGTAGTPGYPFSKQNLLWTAVGRSIQLSPHLGVLTGEFGYLFFLKGLTNHLTSGASVTLTWSKSF